MLTVTSPMFISGLRPLVGGIILLSYSFITKKYRRINKQDFFTLIQIALLTVFIREVFKNYALKYMTSIKTGFFHNLDPFIAALYAYLIFSETLNKRKWIGMLIAFLGALVYLFSSSPIEQSFGEMFFLSFPEISIILSIAASRLGWFNIQYMVRDRGYSPTFVTGTGMTIGGTLALVLSYFVESGPHITDYRLFFMYFVFVVVASNIIGHNLYAHLHKVHSGTLITLVGFSQPLFVAIYGIFFLGETFTWYYAISTLFVFIGVGIFYKDEIKKGLRKT